MTISDVAKSSPTDILISSVFWQENWKFVAILFVGMLAFVALFPLTYPRSSEWYAWLSIIIHGFFGWGIWVATKTLAKIQVEHAFASRVGEIARTKLGEISNKQTDRVRLDNVGDLLPDNKQLAMYRLCDHILTEAKDHRISSSVVTMQPYRDEAMGDIFKLQNIQKLALQLGILGTFIGLIKAFSKLDLTSNHNLLIQSLLDSLHISFSTSVAGLEAATIVGLLIMVVREKQDAYFQCMETATDGMISLAQNAIPDSYFFTGFEQVTNAVTNLEKRVFAQTAEVERQTDEMQRGINKLVETKSQFKEFLNQIQESQKQFVTEMMNVYNVFSPTTIAAELQQQLDHLVNQIIETFNERLTPSLEKLTALNTAIHGLHESLQTADHRLAEQNQQLEKVNQELLQTKSSLYSSIQQLLTAQKEFIDDAVEQLAEGNQKLTQSKGEFYASLQPLIVSQNETFQYFRRDVEAMVQKITALNAELEKSNKIVQDLIQIVTSEKPLYKIIWEKLKSALKS